MTRNQEKALAALVTSSTIKAAAAAAGVDYRTMRRYLDDPAFLKEYRQMSAEMLKDAQRRSRQLLSPAMETLAEICTSTEARNMERIAAARAIMEWSVKLTELTDIEDRLEALENAIYADAE